MPEHVTLQVSDQVAWWRPLVHWFLCLPHLAYSGALAVASVPAAVAAALALLVTGRVPRRLVGFQALALRERVRAFGYLFVLRTSPPPYPTAATLTDPGDDPAVSVSFPVPAAAGRLDGVTRAAAALPHVLALLPVGLVLDLCYPLWMAVVAANRGWPPGSALFLVRVERWVVSVVAHAFLVSDTPPRFGLAAYGDTTGPTPAAA